MLGKTHFILGFTMCQCYSSMQCILILYNYYWCWIGYINEQQYNEPQCQCCKWYILDFWADLMVIYHSTISRWWSSSHGLSCNMHTIPTNYPCYFRHSNWHIAIKFNFKSSKSLELVVSRYKCRKIFRSYGCCKFNIFLIYTLLYNYGPGWKCILFECIWNMPTKWIYRMLNAW